MNPISPLPEIMIEREGIALSAQETIALGEVSVHQSLSQPVRCELIFRDPPGPLGIDSSLQPGTLIRVLVRSQRIPLFVGQVTAVEYRYQPSGGREFCVRAHDSLHRLSKNGTVRAHVQVSLSDLAQQLGGFAVQSEVDTPVFRYVIQHRQSDLELLQEIALRSGLCFILREDTLHILSLAGIAGDVQSLTLGENLLEAEIGIDSDWATDQVAASGWDIAHIDALTGTATSPRSGRRVNAGISPGDVGASGSFPLVDLFAEDAAQTEGLAQSELDDRASREVLFSGTAQGDTRLRPGALIDVDGVTRDLNGTYVLGTVNHIINQQVGYLTELNTWWHRPRPRPHGTIATPGVVTDIDDPEGLGRVRVSLPGFANVNTDWINVMSIGAGAGKGLMIQPDVNDGVLVLLAHEDPAQAVVIGGLYGSHGTLDSGIESGAVKRYTLLTPGGQRVKLDDVSNVIRLENHDGSFVELSDSKVTIHAACDLLIEAPGQAIEIKGKTVDFTRAT